jgi:hypothetical protein
VGARGGQTRTATSPDTRSRALTSHTASPRKARLTAFQRACGLLPPRSHAGGRRTGTAGGVQLRGVLVPPAPPALATTWWLLLELPACAWRRRQQRGREVCSRHLLA